MIRFTLPIIGTPKQSDRQRVVRPKTGKPFARHYQPEKVMQSQKDLAALMAPYVPEAPLEGPLHLALRFRYPWRKSETKTGRAAGYKWKDTKPDLENLSKNLCDVMQACGFFKDDGQLAVLTLRKQWITQGGIDVELAALAESEECDARMS